MVLDDGKALAVVECVERYEVEKKNYQYIFILRVNKQQNRRDRQKQDDMCLKWSAWNKWWGWRCEIELEMKGYKEGMNLLEGTQAEPMDRKLGMYNRDLGMWNQENKEGVMAM